MANQLRSPSRFAQETSQESRRKVPLLGGPMNDDEHMGVYVKIYVLGNRPRPEVQAHAGATIKVIKHCAI